MLFFLPYATDRPRRRTPWMTYALLLANCVVYFAFELPYWLDGGQGVGPLGFVPTRATIGSLFISMFSHASLGHLGFNMLFLWLFGSVVEDVLGPLLFLSFYFGGQLGATLLDALVTQAYEPAALAVPRIGASGAIAAILGLSAVCFGRVRVRIFYVYWFLLLRAGVVRLQSWVFLGIWIVSQVASGIAATDPTATGGASGGVGYWAHIGGFMAGVIGAWVLGLPGRIRRHDLLSGVIYSHDEPYDRYGNLSEIVERSPEDAEAWFELGRTRERLALGGNATEAYAKAVTAFLQRHEPERAAEAYLALQRNDPGVVLPPAEQFDVAVGLARSGRYAEARAALDKVLFEYPHTREAEVAWIRAGELAEKTNDPGTAANYYREYLRRYAYGQWSDHARGRLAEVERR